MCTAPRCPSCRASIGFNYDSKKGEAQFLLYEKQQSVRDGMILLPQGYKPGTEIVGQNRRYFLREMGERVKPVFLKMIAEKNVGEEEARTCVCGGKNCFRRMTMKQRREKAWNPTKVTPFCDACGKRKYEVDENGHARLDEKGQTILIGTHIWACERKSVAHLCGIDVCDDCMSRDPTLGFPSNVLNFW